MTNHFFIYLIEASLCQLVFYVVYVLLLKRETYFKLNRYYLLTTFIVSLVIPAIRIKQEVLPSVIIEPFHETVYPIQQTAQLLENRIETRIDLLFIVQIIYLIIATIIVVKLVYQFLRLIQFIRKGEISVVNRHYLICSNGQYPTSSFFKYILWDNTVSLTDQEIEQIIKHEMAHINQFHTLDNLVMEFAGIVFWFNPIIYLYNKELKQVHEYLADAEVVTYSGFSFDEYKVLINKQILNNIGFQLSNNFNMSNLKTRIAMMTKPKSGKLAMLKLSIAIPAAAIMMLSFSTVKDVVTDEKTADGLHLVFYKGNFKGQNIKIHNPSSTTYGDPGYSIKKIMVNEKVVLNAEQCKFDNFEIALNSMGLKNGEKLKIEIEYLDEAPIVKNLEAIQDPISNVNIHAVIAGNNFLEGYMTTEELLAAGEIEINDKKYILKNYSMKAKMNGMYVVENANTPIFAHNMRGLLKKVKSGDTVRFTNIHAQAFDDHESYGSIVKLPGVNVIIK